MQLNEPQRDHSKIFANSLKYFISWSIREHFPQVGDRREAVQSKVIKKEDETMEISGAKGNATEQSNPTAQL